MPGTTNKARATRRRQHSQSASPDRQLLRRGQKKTFLPSASLRHRRRPTENETHCREQVVQMLLGALTDSCAAPTFRQTKENHFPRRVAFWSRNFHQATSGERIHAALHGLQLLFPA